MIPLSNIALVGGEDGVEPGLRGRWEAEGNENKEGYFLLDTIKFINRHSKRTKRTYRENERPNSARILSGLSTQGGGEYH